jgi:hypothetical protein
MTAITERRARMLLRCSVVSAFSLSAVSLAFGLHWFTLRREATLPFAAWCTLTSLCLYLSARWLRRRQLPL